MTGLGAWSFGFYHKGMAVPNTRVGHGIIAFKQALIDNGYGKGIDVTLQVFGSSMDKRTRQFQTNMGLKVDGIIGPDTALHLFRHYTYAEEQADTIEIPDHLLTKLGGEESEHDPVAQGYEDPEDEGWGQIHLAPTVNVTQEQAWAPSFAIPYASRGLKTFYVNKIADWDGAVASWNVGSTVAKGWVQAGKPTSGGPIIDGIDFYTRAYNYVQGVRSRSA